MATTGVTARRAAVAMLDAVFGEGRLLSEDGAEGSAFDGLEPGERARAQRLARMVLRHTEAADAVLAKYLRKSPPLTVRNVLRLATCELLVEEGAAHGVVNAGVEMVRRGRKTGHLSGLVNAVLRRVAFEGAAVWAKQPPQRMPLWLRQPLVHRLGREVVSRIEVVQAAGAPLDLTLKDAALAPALAETLGAEILPGGSLRLAAQGQVSELPGYGEGDWWVQDAAAAMPVRLLAPKPGEKIADLCAAPGGKTLQLAAAGAEVWAVDLSERRLARLHENLARCELTAHVTVADALSWGTEGSLDAVLVDAPCSATGTIRRHPDLPFVKDGSELASLTALQAQMIDRALALLRPGGRMVFCTCSLLPEEGEDQVTAALSRHPGLTVLPVDAAALGADAEWRTPEGGLRLRPDYWAEKGGMDGFYMAALCRAG